MFQLSGSSFLKSYKKNPYEIISPLLKQHDSFVWCPDWFWNCPKIIFPQWSLFPNIISDGIQLMARFRFNVIYAKNHWCSRVTWLTTTFENNVNILTLWPVDTLSAPPSHRKFNEYLTDQNGRKRQRNSSIHFQHRGPGSHQRVHARNPERANSTLPSELVSSSHPQYPHF